MSEKTTVVNKLCQEWDVFIGRPSKWGNPFYIGRDGSREEVIEKYRAWVLWQPHLLNALSELRGKRLGCYCKPRGCHGDVLAELADQRPDAGESISAGGNLSLVRVSASKSVPHLDKNRNDV